DAAILAGSVHSNALQPALSAFAGAAAGALERLPTLLLVVSLSAAGSEADDWRGLDRVVAEFTAATGWTPGRVEHVAGAFRFSRYGPVERFVMRRIAHARDPGLDTASDHEYTDWPRLDAALARWLESLSG